MLTKRVNLPVPRSQRGVTLIELMVAMVISLVVSGAMVMLMANTLGTGTRTIGMTHLTQEMRTAMQIMSRDLRRANYMRPIDMRKCFGNVNCIADLGFTGKVGAVAIGADSDGDGFGECLSFWLDRNQDGAFTTNDIGAFRLFVASGVGRMQVLTNHTGMDPNNCPTGTWVSITDPDIIDVQSFIVDDTGTYTEVINGTGSTQTVQNVRLAMTAELTNDGSGTFTISREIGDNIRVRNNFTTL